MSTRRPDYIIRYIFPTISPCDGCGRRLRGGHNGVRGRRMFRRCHHCRTSNLVLAIGVEEDHGTPTSTLRALS